MAITTSTGAAKPRPASKLIDDVARSVGKENNDKARSQALGYLNDIINELNTYQPWQCLRTESTGNAFTDNTATYSLGYSAHKIEVVWIADEDGNPLWKVEEMDYAGYKDFDPLHEMDAYRYFYTRNLHADATITFIGTPGTDVTETYNVGYIARIPQLTANDTLDIPREFDRVLVAGAKYLMRDNSATADPQQVGRSYADYQRVLQRIRDADRNHPAEHPRWRLPSGTRGLDQKYFRISLT